MKKKVLITKENIKQKFKSQFDLVNYSIKLAEQFMLSGRAPYTKIDSLNPANIIIDEVEEGKDKLEDIIVVSSEVIVHPQEVEKAPLIEKHSEKKKTRRIFA